MLLKSQEWIGFPIAFLLMRGCARRYMIESVKLQNFRSFQEVSIPDCRLINVVVGDNGSGKTALLEAIFLAAGASPELSLRTRQWRGAERGELSGSREEMFFEIWSDLFHQFTTSKPVLISLGVVDKG